MIIEGKTAAEIGTQIYQNRNLIGQYSRKVWNLLTKGYLRLLVFGPGGTGKTTLGRSLTEGIDPANEAEYEESITQEGFSVPGDVFGSLIVPPGQEIRQEQHWPDLYEILQAGKSAGVINVVSWGFHSIQDLGYEQTNSFEAGMSKEEFVAAYTDNRRRREIDVVETLKPRLEDAPGDLWMITLATKQDLWWNDRMDVVNWYTDGPYGSVIRDIERSRGRQHFVHEYLSASLIIQNFVDGHGELLARTASGYDEPTKLAHLQRMKRTITELVMS